MSDPSPLPRIVRFGAYQCDLSAGELHKNGIKVKLSDQPFRLLTILLERPGRVLTRRELGERLWPAGTFVAFEDGLNTAVKKLRAALDDPPENPRFLETIPRRGYRFIAPVEAIGANGSAEREAALAAEEIAEPRATRVTPNGALSRWQSRLLWTAAAAAVATALFAVWWNLPLPPPRVLRAERITNSSRIDTPVKPESDGSHVYYIERDGGHWNLMEAPVNGGEEQHIAFPEGNAMVMDVSARASELLLGSFPSRGVAPQLWSEPLEGGAAVRLGDTTGTTAAFSPDGSQIAYISDNSLWMMNAQTRNARSVARLPNSTRWLAWSPDGKSLRFTAGALFDGEETSLWEIRSDGGGLHRIALGFVKPAAVCCGAWTPDGRYYIFTAYRNGRSNLWALREKSSFWRRSPRGPFQLTFGPDSPWGGTPSPDGQSIFYYNGTLHEELQKLDVNRGQLSTLAIYPQATLVSYSRDGNWIAYVDAQDLGLYRSRPDGSEQIELASPSAGAAFPRWSPDGKWIAFNAKTATGRETPFVVPSGGGEAKALLPGGAEATDVDWSGDGQTLVASEAAEGKDANGRRLVLIDFASKKATEIPGSEHLAMSRWSFDGRFISATSEDQKQLKIWDVTRREWRTIAHGTALGIGVWSPDSRYLYFQDLLGKGEALFRYDVSSGRVDTVAQFSSTLRAGAYRCALFAVTPSGEPIIGLDRSAYDLFAARVEFP